MKLIFLIGATVAYALTGCHPTAGISGRIREKSAVFAHLTAAQQGNIEQGVIEVGYTTDMVYMALGKPQKVREEILPEGKEVVWIFENFVPPPTMALLGYNQPGRQGYNPGINSTNASISFGGKGGPEPSIDGMPELPTETLHVIFLNGVVFELKVAR